VGRYPVAARFRRRPDERGVGASGQQACVDWNKGVVRN
jgi:hypothetical protein